MLTVFCLMGRIGLREGSTSTKVRLVEVFTFWHVVKLVIGLNNLLNRMDIIGDVHALSKNIVDDDSDLGDDPEVVVESQTEDFASVLIGYQIGFDSAIYFEDTAVVVEVCFIRFTG